jgi:hypothetical protein
MTWRESDSHCSVKILAMIASLRNLLDWTVSAIRSPKEVLENLPLCRQLLALHAQRPRRRLTALHKLLWVALRTFWSGWSKPLVLVSPRTVVNWPCFICMGMLMPDATIWPIDSGVTATQWGS